MKIAIDVDDTLSNTLEVDFATCYMYNKKLHPNDDKLYEMNYHNAPTIFGFDKKTDDEFYVWQRHEVVKNGWITPKFFAKETLDELLKKGHEVIILTSRGDMYWGDAEKETKNWLQKYNFNYSRLVANCQSKGEFCRENKIDVLIDDNSKYVGQANEQGINSILILAPYNKDYNNSLNKFASCWSEVIYKIDEIEGERKNGIKL